jgi:5'-3' exonuclease
MSFMEQVYHLLCLFLKYKIYAIFIFDGKSPPEKSNVIHNRYMQKKEAESKYDEIQRNLLAMDKNSGEYMSACRELIYLQKKMVRLRSEHIVQSKELMCAFGFAYYDAPGESDQLCAHFVKSGAAWACLSDDMDMFLLDCPRVLRIMSVANHTWTLYHTASIFKELDISLQDLREIVVMCGSSDYNYDMVSFPSIKNMFSVYYREYKKWKKENMDISFYAWYMKTHDKMENNMPAEKMSHLCSLFNTTNCANILQPFCDLFSCDRLKNNQMKLESLKRIMENHGFIFVGK